jgi:hypothetical protein
MLAKGGAMPAVNMSTFANILAAYARQKLNDVDRAAILVRCTRDGTMVAAVFGNDQYATNQQARQEVQLLRKRLHDVALEELGFGLSSDASSWALLVHAENASFQTAAGKAFRTEMLRAYLEDAVWAAWRTAGGADPREAGWPILMTR